MEQRKNEGQRTLGELFFYLVDEMADITFTRVLYPYESPYGKLTGSTET